MSGAGFGAGGRLRVAAGRAPSGRGGAAELRRGICAAGWAAMGVTGLMAADGSKVLFPGGDPRAPSPAAPGGVANTAACVVALCIAAIGAWCYWRHRRAGGAPRDGRGLAIDETRSLGNRQHLVVASYEGRKFLLGVCPGRIDLLAPLTERRGGDESTR